MVYSKPGEPGRPGMWERDEMVTLCVRASLFLRDENLYWKSSLFWFPDQARAVDKGELLGHYQKWLCFCGADTKQEFISTTGPDRILTDYNSIRSLQQHMSPGETYISDLWTPAMAKGVFEEYFMQSGWPQATHATLGWGVYVSIKHIFILPWSLQNVNSLKNQLSLTFAIIW